MEFRRGMKKYLAIAAAVATLSCLWLVRSRHAAQARRDAAYQIQLKRFQHDLRLGMPRSAVEQYLYKGKISYSNISGSLGVMVGQDPGDGIVCGKYYVYIEMDFVYLKGQTEPSPFDNLDSISVKKYGGCL